MSAESFENMVGMVRHACTEALAAEEWKVALDLLQMACTYHDEVAGQSPRSRVHSRSCAGMYVSLQVGVQGAPVQAGELLLGRLVGLEGLDARFWYGAYLAQCNHERRKFLDGVDARSSVDMRMVEENTHLSQALSILSLMKDAGAPTDERFGLAQRAVSAGLIRVEQANAWFAEVRGAGHPPSTPSRVTP